jgi:hypothetical protein
MNEYTQKKFDLITAKDLEDLSDGEKAFVKARRSYLSKKQEEKFAKLLKPAKKSKK